MSLTRGEQETTGGAAADLQQQCRARQAAEKGDQTDEKKTEAERRGRGEKRKQISLFTNRPVASRTGQAAQSAEGTRRVE